MQSSFLKTVTTAVIVASAALTLNSCSTNGDPNTGGIFWNESRAQDRLADRQDQLTDLQKRTRTAERNAASRQRKINALR